MADVAVPILEAKTISKPGQHGLFIFVVALFAGVLYVGWHLVTEIRSVHSGSLASFVLLAIALLIALGFEFVNGFHDTANAVATVIYTHSLEPHVAVVWSGVCNFLGVLTSSGAVAFGIVSLLPVDLILNVGSRAGFAMVFALLIAAIVWNLGTWYFGIPNSSSHALVGAIMGVGLMNQILATHNTGTSGVDWRQALEVGKSLLFSPLIGFFASALLLLVLKRIIPNPKLYTEPKGTQPPPLWIRAILWLTCTSVSFAHGSNDGQKGMGLIMLILVGIVPTGYALNRGFGDSDLQSLISASDRANRALDVREDAAVNISPEDAKSTLHRFLTSKVLEPNTIAALRSQILRVKEEAQAYSSLKEVPPEETGLIRNDMYVAGEALRLMESKNLLEPPADDREALSGYRHSLDRAIKFIPSWVKVAVAIALGLGTMVGWKRIVVTVGERIGKQHLTYAQGATSELVAAATILAADRFGLPVSTTHVLTSGIGGTMAANNSGLQVGTLRNLVAAWLLTLPVTMALSAGLFWVLLKF